MNTLRGQLKLTLNGKEHSALVNLNALRMLCQADKIELTEMDEFGKKQPMDFMCKVLFYGIKNDALVNDTEGLDMDYEKFCAKLLASEDFEELSNQVTEALGVGK